MLFTRVTLAAACFLAGNEGEEVAVLEWDDAVQVSVADVPFTRAACFLAGKDVVEVAVLEWDDTVACEGVDVFC